MRQGAVCVVGSGAALISLVRRLVANGLHVVAVADAPEECAAIVAEGAEPRSFQELSALAPQLDMLISTTLTRFVDAAIIARLPERAVIVDLASAPGSVDFETAQRLDRKAVWAPPRGRRGATAGADMWDRVQPILRSARSCRSAWRECS